MSQPSTLQNGTIQETLSIITICYNDLEGLQKTLRSLQSQTSKNFEHIIVDGASADGTLEFLKSFTPGWKLTWKSEKDRGIYDAMNKGLLLATGEYVWFLNAGDDCASTQVIEKLLKHLNGPSQNPTDSDSDSDSSPITPISAKKPDLLYGRAWYVGAEKKKSVGAPVAAASFKFGMPICHQAILYKRTLATTKPYPIDYRIISDWIVTQEFFESGALCEFIDLYIANFYLDGISANNHQKLLKEKLRYEKSIPGKLAALFGIGLRFTLVNLSKKMGLYELLIARRPRSNQTNQ